jgi:hypothetical protein
MEQECIRLRTDGKSTFVRVWIEGCVCKNERSHPPCHFHSYGTENNPGFDETSLQILGRVRLS